MTQKSLTAAARLLRATAARLPSGPWDLAEDHGSLTVVSVERDPRTRSGHIIARLTDTPGHRDLLTYLALMDPTVATRCAHWLDNTAGRWDSAACTREGEYAFQVTRAVLGDHGGM